MSSTRTGVSARALEQMPLQLPGGGQVLFSGRAHGNMSSVGGERAQHAAGARERLRGQLGLRCLARGYQEHGTAIAHVTRLPDAQAPEEQRPRADGQATTIVGVGAMVLSADCLPVALGGQGAVVMVHAGWRGLAAGVLEAGVAALRELVGEESIAAIVGPAAGSCCYEVGEEVHAAFAGAHRHGRNIDLRAIAHERLLAAGVSDVSDLDRCTICDERYFSHRREGARSGRQAGVAWLS